MENEENANQNIITLTLTTFKGSGVHVGSFIIRRVSSIFAFVQIYGLKLYFI